MKTIDSIDEKILSLLSEHEGVDFSLKQIQNSVGLDHPQKVVHRLQQLEKKGYLRKGEEGYIVHQDPIKDVVDLPLYGSAQCGNKGSAIVEEYSRDKITISTKLFNIGSDFSDYFFVKAKGDSMEPLIKDGDLLLIRQTPIISESDKVLIAHNGKPKIKKLVYSKGKNYLISTNKDHEKLEILSEDDANIVGVVKRVIKSL